MDTVVGGLSCSDRQKGSRPFCLSSKGSIVISIAFDYVVTSEEAGADKPAEAPFRIALGKLQVALERCWMIGDNPETDIRGGGAFNICTLHKQNGAIKRDKTADAVFEDFGDLRRFLAQRAWISQTFNLINA